MTIVLDSSAVVTLLLRRKGNEKVKALIADRSNDVRIHRQNATEVRYVMHRRFALAAFIAQHPERVHPNSNERPDLTGLNLDDPSIFDVAVAAQKADERMSDLVAAGVSIEGDTEYPDLWIRASKLKSRWRRVSLADCFGLALAIELGAPFWTSDRHELEAVQQAGVAQIIFIR